MKDFVMRAELSSQFDIRLKFSPQFINALHTSFAMNDKRRWWHYVAKMKKLNLPLHETSRFDLANLPIEPTDQNQIVQPVFDKEDQLTERMARRRNIMKQFLQLT